MITLPKIIQRRQGAFAVFRQPIVTGLQLLLRERWADRALTQPGQKIFRQLAGVVGDLRKLCKKRLLYLHTSSRDGDTNRMQGPGS
ncbi:hypothetical protein, partial [Serratia marcescens]|uniref:hypothetical protein n=1 Tax=Serratia marcescens TaxID=615 RepID=UPI001BD2E255